MIGEAADAVELALEDPVRVRERLVRSTAFIGSITGRAPRSCARSRPTRAVGDRIAAGVGLVVAALHEQPAPARRCAAATSRRAASRPRAGSDAWPAASASSIGSLAEVLVACRGPRRSPARRRTRPWGSRPRSRPRTSEWSSTSMASRLSRGSIDGPFGTAQDRNVPPTSSRKSKCRLVACVLLDHVARHSRPASPAERLDGQRALVAGLDLERRVRRRRSARAAARASSRRWACVSHPARTVTCAEIAGKPEVTSHTCRSCTSTTWFCAASALPISSRVEVARRRLEQHAAGLAQQAEARAQHQRGHHQRGDAVRAREAGDQHDRARDRGGDEREQVGEHVLERALDVEAAAAPRRRAASSPRGSPRCRRSRPRARRRPRRPAGRSGGGSPPPTITTASATSVAPFSCADRISARRKPNVKPPRAGRCASRAANSASAIAPASVSMCAASESSASEEARMPATTSTAIRPRISASATVRRRVSSVWTCVCAWAWSCMAPVG